MSFFFFFYYYYLDSTVAALSASVSAYLKYKLKLKHKTNRKRRWDEKRWRKRVFTSPTPSSASSTPGNFRRVITESGDETDAVRIGQNGEGFGRVSVTKSSPSRSLSLSLYLFSQFKNLKSIVTLLFYSVVELWFIFLCTLVFFTATCYHRFTRIPSSNDFIDGHRSIQHVARNTVKCN